MVVASLFIAIPVCYEATIARTIPRDVFLLLYFHSSSSEATAESNDARMKGGRKGGLKEEKMANPSRRTLWILRQTTRDISSASWKDTFTPFFISLSFGSFFFFFFFISVKSSSWITRNENERAFPVKIRLAAFPASFFRPDYYKFSFRSTQGKSAFAGVLFRVLCEPDLYGR